MKRAWIALVLALLLPGTGLARPAHRHAAEASQRRTIFRVADHGDFGRIVFQLPASATGAGAPIQTRNGDVLTLDLPGAGAVQAASPGADMTRHVRGISSGIDRAVITLDRGGLVRVWSDRSRLIVDVFGVSRPAEPAPAIVPPPPAAASAGPAQKAPPHPTLSAPPPAAPERRTAIAPMDRVPVAEPAPVLSEPAVSTDSLMAARLDGAGDAMLLPFAAQTGAAAFPRGGDAVLVFDESKAIDLSGLKDDAVFGRGRIAVLPDATVLTMPAPAGGYVALRRDKPGWVVQVIHGRAPAEAAATHLSADVLSITASDPASTVVIGDRATGGRLLIGTVRKHGPAVLVPHASPEFTILPSWEGVAVLAGSDRLALRAARSGFDLAAATGPKLSAIVDEASLAALARAGTLTRRFDFQPLPVPALFAQLNSDIAASAAAPKQARFSTRLRVAQDMLGLGMDHEASAVLTAARADDPAPDGQDAGLALLAIAQALAGSAAQNGAVPAAALDSPSLGTSDEVALWQALLPSHAAPLPERAAVIAADWRLLLGYPDPLRRRAMALAAPLLVDGGQLDAAGALLAAAGDSSLDVTRARLLQVQGKTDAALAVLDRVVATGDRKAQALARRRAVDMRLAGGTVKPAAGADILLSHIDDWREPDVEAATRQHAANLLMQAGDFRRALSELRQTAALFPTAQDSVHNAERQVIAALTKDGDAARLAPLDLVALIEENSDLLAEGDVASSLTPVLVDKLVALDLPDRAEKLVSRLMETAGDAAAKAAFGDRLAGLRLDQRDATGALDALDRSDTAGLAADVTAARTLKRAQALVLIGRQDDALRSLAGADSSEAVLLRASLQENTRDWRGAETSLQMLLRAQAPAAGTLSAPQQDLVLRLAAAASQAGDADCLRSLQDKYAQRLTPGPRATLFQTLASPPVRSVADLARSGREADVARALPAALTQYGSH